MPPLLAVSLQVRAPLADDELLVLAAAALLVLLLAYGVTRRFVPTYNRFVELEEDVKNARSNIDSLLQRRRDELNRLFIAAREATGHESSTLSDVVDARKAVDADASTERQALADQQALRALTQFDAREEEYPEINAVGNIERLQENIVKIEEDLAEQREIYNETVTKYNKHVRKFPRSAVASVANFEPREQFTPSGALIGGDEFGLEPPSEASLSLDGATEQERAFEDGDRERAIEDEDRQRALGSADPQDASDPQ